MKISEIYEKYKIMPNLQEHMLRVAAVASLICDNFDEPVNENKMITVCLLHDMGNIIKTDFLAFPEEFYAPEGREYWEKVKEEFIKKYGDDEDEATRNVLEELKINPKLVAIASENYFPMLCKLQDSEDFFSKIVKYSDLRAGPYGILSYEDRMMEARKRYEHLNDYLGGKENRERLVACGKDIEKQIFAKCKLRPEDFTDEAVRPIISELREFVIS